MVLHSGYSGFYMSGYWKALVLGLRAYRFNESFLRCRLV